MQFRLYHYFRSDFSTNQTHAQQNRKSLLRRCIRSTDLVLMEMGQVGVRVGKMKLEGQYNVGQVLYPLHPGPLFVRANIVSHIAYLLFLMLLVEGIHPSE